MWGQEEVSEPRNELDVSGNTEECQKQEVIDQVSFKSK